MVNTGKVLNTKNNHEFLLSQVEKALYFQFCELHQHGTTHICIIFFIVCINFMDIVLHTCTCLFHLLI